MGKLPFLIMLIVLSGIALADFTAYSGDGEILVCQDSTQVNTILIKNTGTDEISLDITGSIWSTYYPDSITLKPGEQVPVYDFINPLDTEPGLYEISTKISDSVAKELKQIVSVKECPKTIVSNGESFSNCPCTSTYYAFTIQNTGDDYETYSLGVNSEYVKIDDNPVTIPPKGNYTAYVTVELPCDMTGDYEFTFVTQASTGFRTETPFYLNSRAGCFDYGLEFGNAALTEEFTLKDSKYRICSRENLIPVRFTNTGEFETSIDYASELETGTIELETGAQEVVYLPIDMPKGEYRYTLNTSNDKTSRDESFLVKVSDCGDEEFPKSSGLNLIIVIVLIIIIFLVAFFVIKESPDYPETKKTKSWKWIIYVIATLLLIGLIVVISRKIGWFMDIYYSILSFVILYWLYFLIGIVAALIIIFIHWKESWFRMTSMYFLIVVVAGVIFLMLSMCFFGGICKINATTQSSMTESSTTYITNMNQVKKINLGKFVNNPDHDELTFTATPVDGLNISFMDSVALISPMKDFSGEQTVNFIVEDAHGARAVSPDITIVVLDKEAKFYEPVLNMISRFTNIFLFLVMLAIVMIILLILRTQRPKKRIVKRKVNK